MQLRRRSDGTPGGVGRGDDKRGKRSLRALRGGALFGVVGLLGVGMAVGDRFEARPADLSDGSAWVGSGDDLVRGSSITGRADALVEGALKGGGVEIAQDGRDAMVVVGDRAFSMDASTLEPAGKKKVKQGTRALTRGGSGYLISPGLISCVDPQTLASTGEAIQTPATASGVAPGVVDGRGRLWVSMKLTGEVWRISDCEVGPREVVFPEGHDVVLTLAGGTPVLHDRTAHTVTWLDARTGEGLAVGEVPEGAVVQGPSLEGDRVWLSGPGRTLTSVDRDGNVEQVELSVGKLRKPESVGERVLVPSTEGKVVIVDAPEGEAASESVVKDLPGAAAEDFVSFLQDGQAWYSAPSVDESGWIAEDGEIELLEIRKDELRAAAEQAPTEPEDVAPPPPIVQTPTSTPDTPDQPVTPSTPVTTPVNPELPDPGPAATTTTPTMAPATTTTTTAPTTTTTAPVTVPNVVGKPVTDACAELSGLGIPCEPVEYQEEGTTLDTVMAQSVAAGDPAPATGGVQVSYYASTTIPNLAGLDATQACTALQNARLKCNPVSATSASEAVKPQGVFGPYPSGTVAAHSSVTYNVDDTVWRELFSCRAPAIPAEPDDTDNYRTSYAPPGTTCPASEPESWSMGLIADRAGAGRVQLWVWTVNAVTMADQNLSHAIRFTTGTDAPAGSNYNPKVLVGWVHSTLPQGVTGMQLLTTAFGGADGAPAARGSFLYLMANLTIPERTYNGTDTYKPPLYWTWQAP